MRFMQSAKVVGGGGGGGCCVNLAAVSYSHRNLSSMAMHVVRNKAYWPTI